MFSKGIKLLYLRKLLKYKKKFNFRKFLKYKRKIVFTLDEKFG